ncbi:hypothetical protein QC761_500150 [Podospora bellae-mahoneyi]|uniref:Uncharacterized protein n=1 Tax=Podospora bellae-mahoneyi TaxID=2093777 RepID=A0ABR0FD68_9PEZI|nr:hypothetical protein QC761_500150 [Podospora bellae-mahoneyi]
MTGKQPARPLPFTPLSELYPDSEPPSKKPRVDTTQYTRANRRARAFPRIQPPTTTSQSSSRSLSSNADTDDPIDVPWWDPKVTESSASSSGRTSVKQTTTRSIKGRPNPSKMYKSARKASRTDQDSPTEEERIDDHDPKMSEDYLPFGPPWPPNETRDRGGSPPKPKDKANRGNVVPGISPTQSMIKMIAAGDYIPFSPDSPVATRQQQEVFPPGPRRSSVVPLNLRTRIGNQSPFGFDRVNDPPPTVAAEAQAETYQALEEVSIPNLGAECPQTEVDSTLWNPVLLGVRNERKDGNRVWPARKGGIYCDTCFRDECIRWIRARDKALSVSRLLGVGGEPEGMNPIESVIFPDQIKHRANKLFRRTPPDVLGLALLRYLAQTRVEALGEDTQDEVTGTLDSLRQDIRLSKGRLKRLERQCRTLVETCVVSESDQKKIIPEGVVWLWEFDALLQDVNKRSSNETPLDMSFPTTLTNRAHEAAIDEFWNMAVAHINVKDSMGHRTKTELLRLIRTAMAQAATESKQEKRGRAGEPLPCQYCAQSESVNSKTARNSNGRAVKVKPWIEPLVWSGEMSEETASSASAEEFFRLVESRGAVMAEVSGIKFLVDSTGGKRRIVLVEMASVFDDMWKERQEDKRFSSIPAIAAHERESLRWRSANPPYM